ncbi:MAG: ATP-binding protein, partial [Cyanobacteria bacterium J083]
MTNLIAHLNSKHILREIASLLLYQSIFQTSVGKAYLNLLQIIQKGDSNSAFACLSAYGNWFKSLATINQSWQDYLINSILQNDNPFSQQSQLKTYTDLPSSLRDAAKHDLSALEKIYRLESKQISEWVKTIAGINFHPLIWSIEPENHSFLAKADDWTKTIPDLAQYYKINGIGIFAQYRAFTWSNQQLIGISHPDPVKLADIVGYNDQKQTLIQNTKALLSGYLALNILLYGSRGSGKSSLVKALSNEFGVAKPDHPVSKQLKLLEVSKLELINLPTIVEKLRHLPQKFIIFVDDLSFEEDDEAFKALKVVLEGSVTSSANNVVVYATSNRRHLVREFFAERPRPKDADEIHTWDTLQEKLSFSDRFGITLTFQPANQDKYLEIVHHLASTNKLSLPTEKLEFLAKQWATRHNGFSGRTARQFINYLVSQSNL